MAFVLTPWQPPPSRPELSDHSLHLWRFPLICHEPLEQFLNEQELQRARRLLVPAKARAFITARARLRQILGLYLDLDPQSLHFNYGASGKPVLAGDSSDDLSFNLAHSGGWGLCAVTRGVAVGVDIEKLDWQLDYVKLAAGFFSTCEQDWLLTVDLHRRRRAFFRIWTRKEAWLKGKGGGFSDPDQDIGPVHLQGSCTCDNSWWLRSFTVSRNYLAALAVPQEFSLVQRWDAWRK